MSARQSAEYATAEKKLKRFLDAQTNVFQLHRELLDWCKASLDGEYDQRNYDVSKHVLKDVIAFEGAFDDFEVEFWNYAADIDGMRASVDSRVLQQGLADHKEYFFSKIEACVSILSEVVTEVSAVGLGWPFLYDLEESLEKLYDISEELIETDPSQMGSDLVLQLLSKVPPQRLAPLEVVATTTNIRRKVDAHLQSRISDVGMREAATALHEVLLDTYTEFERSNGDPRISRALEKCVGEIGRDFELFSPIRFGIYVGVANSFKDVISDEFTASLARQVISALFQCDIFLRNFNAWKEYSRDEEVTAVGDSSAALRDFQKAADDSIFDDDVRAALDDMAEDKRDFGERGKVDYSIFQSISNSVSEVCRQGLRFLSSLPRSVSSLLAETARDGVKSTIGALAVVWLFKYSELLISLSDRYAFFSWLKPVVEFIKTHAGG
ncbi:hypothetical protein GFB56_15605 [Ensifer sp. T173]|uniref:Uncharacterized protein n=1 Tax=Ensifer canadensis TaxID=555315 RepID=A0AAW4FM86_9HYPH|nr:hypothetical protein [Ensifer canadensis]MBM3092231.1 hypothetical protein [Ensifer canadensis]UBI73955.1 hypothetical protein J3R84_10490 [Ensifer canadensis]